MSLEGKVAVVTGAASGFGLGIATAMINAGADVVLLDLDGDAVNTAAAELGDHAKGVQADVTDAQQIQQALVEIGSWRGDLDIFINNAGVGLPPTTLETVTPEDFERVLSVNMRSIYLTSAAIVPMMKARGSGCILNIASTAGVSPRPGLTWYNASKGWVITATRSMAVELAADNIRVNAINPVAGETPMLSTFMGGDTAEGRERFLNTIPLGRFSTPRDIGDAAVFLCSDAASMITGVALEVDGGRCV